MRLRDLRLHASNGAHFGISDAKTEAGIREVQVSPDLAEEIVAHLDRLRRAGLPTDADAYLFPNMRGGRMSRHETNGETRTRTGDTTIFSRVPKTLELVRNSC